MLCLCCAATCAAIYALPVVAGAPCSLLSSLSEHHFAENKHMSESVCFVFVSLSYSVCCTPPSNLATQHTMLALIAKPNSASRQNDRLTPAKSCHLPAAGLARRRPAESHQCSSLGGTRNNFPAQPDSLTGDTNVKFWM